jgi:cysteine desulfurase
MPDTMPSDTQIYLDYAATTPVDDRVLEAMMPYFNELYGNPSSVHTFGQKAEAALEAARETVAEILNCQTHEIIFTSCGSESDNLALRGAALAAREKRDANHILISPVEHHAVSQTAEQLTKLFGFELEYLPVNSHGMVDPEDVTKYIRDDTAIVSVIYANNEIGTINPIKEISARCREHGIPFHTDAVQGAAYLPVNVNDLDIDLLAIGAHKFYGPKGVGALYVREGTNIYANQTGGGQEFGLRAGTSNIPYIIGLAKAFYLAQIERKQRFDYLRARRDYLIRRVQEEIPSAHLTGHPDKRLPNHASFVFEDVDGNMLLAILDSLGFACSSGSACKTGDPEPSDVLNALGLDRNLALGSLRVTLGIKTTYGELDSFAKVLPTAIQGSVING